MEVDFGNLVGYVEGKAQMCAHPPETPLLVCMPLYPWLQCNKTENLILLEIPKVLKIKNFNREQKVAAVTLNESKACNQ